MFVHYIVRGIGVWKCGRTYSWERGFVLPIVYYFLLFPEKKKRVSFFPFLSFFLFLCMCICGYVFLSFLGGGGGGVRLS